MSYQNSTPTDHTFEVIDYNDLDKEPRPVSPQYIPVQSESSLDNQHQQTRHNDFISSNNIGSNESELASDSLYSTDLSESPTALNIHLVVALVATIVTFLVWHYLNNNSKGSLWWWMYVPFIFAMTITCHVHYYNGNYFKGVVIVCVLLHILLFVIDSQSNDGSPKWVMWPAGISAMILIAFYQVRYNLQDGWFNLALYEFGIMNILFFLAWIRNFSHNSFPWWIIPFFVLSIPVLLAHLKYHRNEQRLWVHGSVALVILSVMTFFIWGFVESYWPWFLIEWGIAAAIIFGLWYYQRRADHYVTVIEEDAFQPGSFSQYSQYGNNNNNNNNSYNNYNNPSSSSYGNYTNTSLSQQNQPYAY